MKFLLSLLVFALLGSASGPSLLAQSAKPAPMMTAADQPKAETDDTFAIPAKTAGSRLAVPAASAPVEEVGMNLWQLVRKGGWAMYPLGFFSILTVMFVLVFLFTLRRGAILTPHYMNTADVLLKKRDYLGLLAISSRHTEAVARIVQRTLDFATKNPGVSYEVIQDIAQTEGGAQAASLQHRVTFLADIGVLSPMIGLLGTVSGIIRAFAKLAEGDASISRDILLASGVSEALFATATGSSWASWRCFSMGSFAIACNRSSRIWRSPRLTSWGCWR